MIVSKCWTYELSGGSLTITENNNLTKISILATLNDTVVTGDLVSGGLLPGPITLAQGQAVTITDGINILSGITITTAGKTSLIGG